jgi:hypothetical protein
MIDRTSATVDIVLSGAQAGAYTVPDELTAAAKVRDLAASLVRDAGERRMTVQAHEVAERVSEAVLEALRATAEPPAEYEAKVLEAERAERAADLALLIANTAAEKAVSIAGHTLDDLAEPILLDHLRPALAETLAAVVKLAPALAGMDPDDAEAMLGASAKAQDARAHLVGLADRRAAIVRAADAIAQFLGVVKHDDDRVFARFRNAGDLWGQNWGARRNFEARGVFPWPTGRLKHVLWAATAEAGAWLPTPAEQDAALAAFLRKTRPALLAGGGTVAARVPWYLADYPGQGA